MIRILIKPLLIKNRIEAFISTVLIPHWGHVLSYSINIVKEKIHDDEKEEKKSNNLNRSK